MNIKVSGFDAGRFKPGINSKHDIDNNNNLITNNNKQAYSLLCRGTIILPINEFS